MAGAVPNRVERLDAGNVSIVVRAAAAAVGFRNRSDDCVERTAEVRKRPHPEVAGETVWAFLMAYRGSFDGFHATEASVSKTCLVRFDNNCYSVAARAVCRPVDVPAYADRLVIRQDGKTVAEHPRLPCWRAHERATPDARDAPQSSSSAATSSSSTNSATCPSHRPAASSSSTS